MQPAGPYYRRNPSFMNHTPRTFEADGVVSDRHLLENRSSSPSSPWWNIPDHFYPSHWSADPPGSDHDGSSPAPQGKTSPGSETTIALLQENTISLASRNSVDALKTEPQLRPVTRGRRFSWDEPLDAPPFAPTKPIPRPRVVTMGMPRTPYSRLPAENPFDLAYFLKTTGPGNSRLSGKDKRRLKHKSALRFLGYKGNRKTLAERVGTVEGYPRRSPSPDFFVPTEGVVQKVSKGGKKYLQIVAEPSDTASLDLAKSIEISKKRSSATLPDKFSTLGTDTFDTWLSSLGLSQEPAEEYSSTTPLEEAKCTLRKVSNESTEVKRKPVPGSDFALSIIEKPDIKKSPSAAATDAKAALFSNPPSTLPTPTVVPIRETIKPEPLSSDEQTTAAAGKEDGTESRGRSTEDSGNERLAGQGMRRPSKEQGRVSPSGTNSSASADDTSGHNRVDSLMDRPDTSSSTERDELRKGALQMTRRSREDKIRARKLRDLQRKRQNIDEIIAQPLPEEHSSSLTRSSSTCDQLERAKMLMRRKDEGNLRPSSMLLSAGQPSPGYTTGYTPVSGTMTLSPIITVAEQMPVPRTKQVKKPARLVLRDRRTSRPLAIAVRTGPDGIPIAAEPATTKDDLTLAHMSGTTYSTCTSGSSGADAHRSSSLKFVPGLESTYSHHSAGHGHSISQQQQQRLSNFTLQTPSAMSVISSNQAGGGQALGHGKTGGSVSGASVSTGASGSGSRSGGIGSGSRARQLEARIEALERQNRLLEAALHAVLKTSGTLNGCPCQASATTDKGSRLSVESAGTAASEASGGSALDVYLGTRLGGIGGRESAGVDGEEA